MTGSTPRVALVTGAARGIGFAIAQALLARGDCVALFDRDGAALAAATQRLDAAAVLAVQGDLTDPAASAKADAACRERWGPVSILVNSAGIPSSKRNGLGAGLAEISDAEWANVLEINLTGAFRMCRQLLPAMASNGWGRVVNIASLAGRTRSMIASADYMASKAGLIALTRAAASEFGPHGITANAIAPGLIATPMAALRPAEANAKVVGQIPVGRMGTAEEIGAAAAYLASDAAGFVNGAVLDINGGVFMN